MLDPDKGGYSEYQLYLARMLVLHPDYKTEGERLFQTLRTVDPNRYEYTH